MCWRGPFTNWTQVMVFLNTSIFKNGLHSKSICTKLLRYAQWTIIHSKAFKIFFPLCRWYGSWRVANGWDFIHKNNWWWCQPILCPFCWLQQTIRWMGKWGQIGYSQRLVNFKMSFWFFEFKKKQRTIWQISALESKKWSNQQGTVVCILVRIRPF